MERPSFDINIKAFEVLNNVKGFEVAIGDPDKGILVRYGGKIFLLSTELLTTDTGAEKYKDVPFDQVVKDFRYVLR